DHPEERAVGGIHFRHGPLRDRVQRSERGRRVVDADHPCATGNNADPDHDDRNAEDKEKLLPARALEAPAPSARSLRHGAPNGSRLGQLTDRRLKSLESRPRGILGQLIGYRSPCKPPLLVQSGYPRFALYDGRSYLDTGMY